MKVKLTPQTSNADSPTPHHDGSLIFAKPWEEDQSFPSFLNFLIQQELDLDQSHAQAEVRYAQTRKSPVVATLTLLQHLDIEKMLIS